MHVPPNLYLNYKALALNEYCKGIARNTDVNCFWIINNAAEVLKKLNRTKVAKHYNSFDFPPSTLTYPTTYSHTHETIALPKTD